MTRDPNDHVSFERRPVSRIARAAFVLLWLAAACLGAAIEPAHATPGSGPSASVESRPARQTPDEPEPGGDDGGEEGDEGEGGDFEPVPAKPVPDTPDSLRKLPAATLPSGAAPMETLGVTKPALGAVRPGAATAPPPPKERGTIFGLHPAVFFAALIVGHVFIVRAVTD